MVHDTSLQVCPIDKFIVYNRVTKSVVVSILLGADIATAGIFDDTLTVNNSIAASDIKLIILAIGTLAATQPVRVSFNNSTAHSRRNSCQIATAEIVVGIGNQITADKQRTNCMLIEHKVTIIPGNRWVYRGVVIFVIIMRAYSNSIISGQ